MRLGLLLVCEITLVKSSTASEISCPFLFITADAAMSSSNTYKIICLLKDHVTGRRVDLIQLLFTFFIIVPASNLAISYLLYTSLIVLLSLPMPFDPVNIIFANFDTLRFTS